MIHGYGRWPAELSLVSSRRAVDGERGALGGELLDAVVPPVGDEDVAAGVDGETPGHVEASDLGAVTSPAVDVFAVRGEPLYPVIVLVGDVDVVVGIDGDARGAVHLAGAAARRAPLVQELAVGGEDGYAVVCSSVM